MCCDSRQEEDVRVVAGSAVVEFEIFCCCCREAIIERKGIMRREVRRQFVPGV